mgnify:FL=1
MKSNINFSYLIFLSVVAALGGFLFGYDAAVISGTISQVTVKLDWMKSRLVGLLVVP